MYAHFVFLAEKSSSLQFTRKREVKIEKTIIMALAKHITTAVYAADAAQ
ncbi:MAG: hypothetical protein AAB110_09410 [Candidatus Desantisbacteria bacterium]